MSGFFDGAAGGVVGGVLSTIGGLISNNSNKKENARNRQFQHDEAVLAHERQLEIMDKQNQWNSPANQRALLEQGGFNPNALFSGGATSISTGASGGAQAGSGSAIPQQNPIDPQGVAALVNAFSDAKLKEKQGNKIDSEVIGQDLHNAFQDMSNQVFERFGMLQAEYNLNATDARRALDDAHRLLVRSQESLNLDELFHLRPEEAAKLTAEVLYINTRTQREDALKLNDEAERKKVLNDIDLSIAFTAATISKLYSERDLNVQQYDLWNPKGNGLLYDEAENRTHLLGANYFNEKFTYDIRKSNWNYFGKVFQRTMNGYYAQGGALRGFNFNIAHLFQFGTPNQQNPIPFNF